MSLMAVKFSESLGSSWYISKQIRPITEQAMAPIPGMSCNETFELNWEKTDTNGI